MTFFLGLCCCVHAKNKTSQTDETEFAANIHQYLNSQTSYHDLMQAWESFDDRALTPMRSNTLKCVLNSDYGAYLTPAAISQHESQAVSIKDHLWLYLLHTCAISHFNEEHNASIGQTSAIKLLQHAEIINSPLLQMDAHMRIAQYHMETDLNLEAMLEHLNEAERLTSETGDMSALANIIIAKYQLLHSFKLTDLRKELLHHQLSTQTSESPEFKMVEYIIQVIESCKRTERSTQLNDHCKQYIAALIGFNMLSSAIVGTDDTNITNQDDYSFFFSTILSSLLLESNEPLKAEPFVDQQTRILARLSAQKNLGISRVLSKRYQYMHQISLAKLHMHKQQYPKALAALNEARHIFRFTENSSIAFQFYQLQHNILYQLRQHAEALSAYESYHELEKHVQAIVDAHKKRLLEEKRLNEIVRHQNQTLDRNNQLQQQFLHKEQNIQQWRNKSIGVGALLLLLIILFATKQKKQRLLAQHQALTDELTGVFNRTYFYNKLKRQLTRHTESAAQPLSLILFDLDYFKAINDQYGHLTGDAVLKQTIECCQQNIRSTDWLARMGGEEFAMVCPETESSEAKRMAERIRQSIETTTIHHLSHHIQTTISLGIAQHHPKDDLDALIHRADSALYEAKKQGRNRTIVLPHPGKR